MLCSIRKYKLLRGVKCSLTKLESERSVKHNTVINLIEQCIEEGKNPMNKVTYISYVLDNFHKMDAFPEHKKLIKKILA